jgi:hypothetical protein
MTLALSWGIQASHEMPHPIYPVSFETPFTATLSGLFCTTKVLVLREMKSYLAASDQLVLLHWQIPPWQVSTLLVQLRAYDCLRNLIEFLLHRISKTTLLNAIL